MNIGDKVIAGNRHCVLHGYTGSKCTVRYGEKIVDVAAGSIRPDCSALERLHDGTIVRSMDLILSIDAHRLRTEHMYNPYVFASFTKIRVFPHQIEEVVWALSRTRVMIADEVGLGKTITAALVVSELMARGQVNKCIFVVPKILEEKWKRELENRFGIDATVLDAEYANSHHKLPEDEFCIVTSIDFVKQEGRQNLLDVEFDMVVIDEAHKLAPGSFRMRAAKALADRTSFMMLLTATPHDGRTESFVERMTLLDRYVSDPDSARHLWKRWIKEDVYDMRGKRVFPPRQTRTVNVELVAEELAVHKKLGEYFDTIEGHADDERKRAIVRFLSIIYKKRASSSLSSLAISMRRRAEKITSQDVDSDTRLPERDDEDYEYEEIQLEAVQGVSIMDPATEAGLLTEIAEMAESVSTDSKLAKLEEVISTIRSGDRDAKIVAFSEYRDTLDYLCDRLAGSEIARIDGSMKMKERQDALDLFTQGKANLMICNDAAGEGIDMQVSNVEINYDIPWNPNRLEQRMGRIHRIGQWRDVYYWNMVVDKENTIDGVMLDTLLEKINEINGDIGGRVFDVIGQILPDLAEHYEELRRLPKNQWRPVVEKRLDDRIRTMKKTSESIDTLLQKSRISREDLDDMREAMDASINTAEVYRFISAYLISKSGSLVSESDNRVTIRLPGDLASRLDTGLVTGTFDKQESSSTGLRYLGLGEPTVEKLLSDMMCCSVSVLEHDTKSGVLCAYRISVKNYKDEEVLAKVVIYFVDSSGSVVEVEPRSIWDYEPSDKNYSQAVLSDATQASGLEANKKRDEIVRSYEEERKADIDGRIATLDANYLNKIQKKEEAIAGIDRRSSPAAERAALQIRIDIDRLRDQHGQQRQREMAGVSLETELQVIGIAQVFPKDDMAENLKIDQAGMDRVMDLERSRPNDYVRDVSMSSCGYDIETPDRRIEVKSHKNDAPSIMTESEWRTAERLGDRYWLYIVRDVFGSASVEEIQNPAKNCHYAREPRSAYRYRIISRREDN